MSWQRPYSDLRASDAERERVVEFLREHALVGRLNHDELEERIGLAYAAVFRGDLERLISDLPRRSQAVAKRRPQPTRAVAQRNEPKPFMVLVGLAALAIPMITVLGAILAVVATVIAVTAMMLPVVLVSLLVLAILKRRRPHGPRHHRGGMAGGFG
jgi:Flp pilus assembly protein TadB